LVAWDKERQRILGLTDAERKQAHNQDYRGREVWGHRGVAISIMSSLDACPYDGCLFDKLVAAIVPHTAEHLPAIMAYATSSEFKAEVRKLDKKLMVTNATLVKVPFDIQHWQKVAVDKYSDGLPTPYSSDPTQWLFNGHPKVQISRCRWLWRGLLGYEWPRQTGSGFPDCPAIGVDGLEVFADEDGIVPLSALRGEASAADRLNALLAASYGEEWSASKLRELLVATGSKANTLGEWLIDDFFDQHCDLFHQRPFVWQIWDGLKGGFNVLVNYHRLAAPGGGGKRTLEKLIYTDLGAWIDAQRQAQKAETEAQMPVWPQPSICAAKLEAILAGDPPFDLFIRWKPLHEQPSAGMPILAMGFA